MSETLIESLTRLEGTAETIKSLMERVTDLESRFAEYSEKATETLKGLSWADTLPDRLEKMEETSSPLKENSTELNENLLETAGKEKSSLESLENSIKDLEKFFGIKN